MRAVRLLACGIASIWMLESCGPARQVANSIGDLRAVQQAVGSAVGQSVVEVQLRNGKHLSIGVVNSPLKSLPDDERRAKARWIAELAYGSYGRKPSLESVGVAFVVQRTYFMVFNYRDSADYFVFLALDLAKS